MITLTDDPAGTLSLPHAHFILFLPLAWSYTVTVLLAVAPVTAEAGCKGVSMNLGAPEIITILVVALLIFGPKKLPELGRGLGSGIREFRKGTQGLKDELEQSFKDEPASAVVQATPSVSVIKTDPQQ